MTDSLNIKIIEAHRSSALSKESKSHFVFEVSFVTEIDKDFDLRQDITIEILNKLIKNRIK